MNPLASGSARTRLFVSLALIAGVHLMLLKFGNTEATPGRLAMSFVISTTMILLSQYLRARFLGPGRRGAQQ